MAEVQANAVEVKLPLLETILLSYKEFWAHFGDVVKVTWPWVFAAPALTWLAAWRQFSWMAGAIEDLKRSVPVGPTPAPVPPMPDVPFDVALWATAANVVVALAVVSIAVAWHRRVILNEPPGFALSNVTGGTFWRYLGEMVLIGVVAGIPVVLLAVSIMFPLLVEYKRMGPASLPAGQMWPEVLMSAVYALAVVAAVRLSLLLPATAIGNRAMKFASSWQRTRGNTLRLVGGLLATTVPPLLLGLVLSVVVAGSPDADLFAMTPRDVMALGSALAAANAVGIGAFLLTLPIAIGFLSHAYRHFFPAV